MSERTPQVDGYIRKNKQWRDELEQMRSIALDAGLTEEIKWRSPCYTTEDGNKKPQRGLTTSSSFLEPRCE